MKIDKTKMRELEKLRGKARAYAKEQDILVKKAMEITGEVDEGGYTFDYILNNYMTTEELLDKLEIEYPK
jgi:hypothetical protein